MSGVPDFYYGPYMGGEFWEGAGMISVAGIFGVLIVLYLLILFVSLVYSVVSYVLHSIGLYTIANRRSIHHSWLAWIPVGNLWLLGSVSDQYQYVVKGKIKNRRKAMLWMYIALVAVYLVWFIFMVVNAFSANNMDTANAGAVIGIIVGVLAIVVLAILISVFRYLAYYDLFVSCNPGNAVLFLVLSIVFPVALPFFVFACRKKDNGMPPRKQPPVQQLMDQLKEEPEEPEQPEVPEEKPVTEEGYAQPEEFEEE